MTILVALLTFAIVIAIVFEITSRAVYGKFLTDDEIILYIEGLKPFEINPYNETILSPKIDLDGNFKITIERLRNRHFISVVQLTPTCKYYISGKGRVPRWSKTNNVIKQLYVEAKN